MGAETESVVTEDVPDALDINDTTVDVDARDPERAL